MPVPLPDDDTVDLRPPDEAEVARIAQGMVSAATPTGGPTPLQRMLLEAMVPAMTGFPAAFGRPRLDAAEYAPSMARRNLAFRTRIVQTMVLVALVLQPLPAEVADRVAAFARELEVDDGMLAVALDVAEGNLGLAAVDFERNGYTATWSAADAAALHTSVALASAWDMAADDKGLAARWASLEQLPVGTLGRRITEFYRARGFRYPGLPGSAPPLLAQHDWVHIVADYGTTVENELEVFAFIARANDDMRAFSLLAMVVSLFETGYLARGAGLFEADRGHLERAGVAARMADAMRRGALCRGSVDFLRTDWFELAPRRVEEAREHFGVVAKEPAAVAAGSVGPWEPGGISPYQLRAGQALAAADGVDYDAFGASPA